MKKLCDASILCSMLCKILCLTFCFCYRMLLRQTLFSLRRRSTNSMDGSFGEDYLNCEKEIERHGLAVKDQNGMR